MIPSIILITCLLLALWTESNSFASVLIKVPLHELVDYFLNTSRLSPSICYTIKKWKLWEGADGIGIAVETVAPVVIAQVLGQP